MEAMISSGLRSVEFFRIQAAVRVISMLFQEQDQAKHLTRRQTIIHGMPERLKQLREKSGLSQDSLAQLVGKGKATISNYERGERTPVPEVIIRYSKIFHCTTDYILMGEGERPVILVEPTPNVDILSRITRIQNELAMMKDDVIHERYK